MRKISCLSYWLIFSFLFTISLLAFSSLMAEENPEQEAYSIEHTPLLRFTHGEKLEIKGSVKAKVEALNFYFSYEGVEQFQVRNMGKAENGSFIYEFDTASLPCLEFDYYLEAKIAEKTIYSPSNAPTQLIKVMGESKQPLPEIPEDLPPPEEEEIKLRLPMSTNGSIQSKILEKEAQPDEKKTTATGNLRIFHTLHKEGALGIDFDSNFSYTNTPPLPEEKRFDLSNMMLSLSKDNHILKAGDININESEYTVSGLGRRGMEYAYDNQKAYVHVFDVSSQQPKGFKGFGIPKSEIGIFGGVAGYTFYENKISVRAIYIGGKDNPQQGVNIGTPSSNTGREGNVMALVEETRLFENKLNLKAEFARSNYDGDLTDNMEAIGDNALNLGAGFSYGAFNLGASYRYVGKDFNSIGLQYLTNDRKGYEATIGLRTDRVNLTGSYTMQKDNVKSDPTKYTTRDNNSNLNLSLTLSENVSLNFGYKRDKQKTFQGDVETSLQDSLTNEYSGALNLSLKQSANINVSFTNSTLSSENNPQNDTSTFTLNLGGSFRRGESFSLTPTFSYSKASDKFTTEETITYNSLLTGEIAFVPRLFSLLFSGSFARSELSPDNISNLLDIGGGLNLYLDKLIKIGSIVFSLKGSYNHSDLSGVQSSDYKIFLQGDFSF